MSLLSAFDATARHLSFTQAAKELFLTQSAVSRQVRILETELGTTLLLRQGKRVFLTAAGEIYAQEVHHAMQLLRQATKKVSTAPSRISLNLALTPILGTKWLLPRLPEFYERHPEFSLHISTHIGKFDLAQAGVDVFLTDAHELWPGLTAHPLMRARSVVVASPDLLARQPLRTPQDLYDHTVLHLVSNTKAWRAFFESNSLEIERVKQGPTFELASHLIQAVLAGMGVALISDLFVMSEINDGSLVAPRIPDLKVPTKTFYLFYPPENEELPPLVALREWILDCVEERS